MPIDQMSLLNLAPRLAMILGVEEWGRLDRVSGPTGRPRWEQRNTLHWSLVVCLSSLHE